MQHLDITAGPICDGLDCAVLGIAIFWPFILGVIVFFGVFFFTFRTYAASKKNKRNKYPSIVVLIIMSTVFLFGVGWVIYSISDMPEKRQESETKQQASEFIEIYDFEIPEYEQTGQLWDSRGFRTSYTKTANNDEYSLLDVTMNNSERTSLEKLCDRSVCKKINYQERPIYYIDSKNSYNFAIENTTVSVVYTEISSSSRFTRIKLPDESAFLKMLIESATLYQP